MTATATQQVPVKRASTYNPLSPVGSAIGLKGLLESQKHGISVALPKHVTPERLIKTFLVAANRIPDLLQCTQASILETINRAAELGLDLSGTLGEAYPVPFNNKVKDGGQEKWVKQCQLIIGYRGLEKLAWQSNELEHIDSEVVCANDTFVFKKGTEVHVEWSPALKDRGEVIGVYACAKFKSGGKLARFLTKADVEKIRNASKSKDSPAWKNWWDEMARAKAIKRMLKDAPLSTEKFVAAMEHDDPSDITLPEVQSVERVAAISDGRKPFGIKQQQQSEPLPTENDQPADAASEQVDTETGEVEQAQSVSEADQETAQQTDQGQDNEASSESEPAGDAGQSDAETRQDRKIDKLDQLASFDKVLDAALEIAPMEEKHLSPLAIKNQFLVFLGGAWAKVAPAKRTELIEALKSGKFEWKSGVVAK